MMRHAGWLFFVTSLATTIYGEGHNRHHNHERGEQRKSHSHMTSCTSDADCDVTKGLTCHWLFDGCSVGRCMCDPRKHRRLSAGNCISVKFGGETCGADDVCVDTMTCKSGKCQCPVGVMTHDGLHCRRSSHRLLGQQCDARHHACFQKSANGYTMHGVFCSDDNDGVCTCESGSRQHGTTCRSLKVNERGCSKFFHCQGGAVCVDGKCQCPSGYTSSASGTKCAKRDAITDLPFDSDCDEINENRYCGNGLVCHRCAEDDVTYRCLRFSIPGVAGFLSNNSLTIRPSLLFLLVALLLQCILYFIQTAVDANYT